MIPDIEAPLGCTWAQYLEHLTSFHGGQAALVDLLLHRGRGVVDLPVDPQTIERGLRRLSAKGNAPGGKYGRWLIRFFGVPAPLETMARWMGQYHSRFADLPTSLRHSQLVLWDRPPVCETGAASWIHLGLASVAMRRRDHDEARARLARVQNAGEVSPSVQVEALLLAARLANETTEQALADDSLRRVRSLLPSLDDPLESACYQARLADQLAYRLMHPAPGTARELDAARAHYASIPDLPVAFAQFRRAHGLAYCAWKAGEDERALELVRRAAEHAADGGLIRFRVMALKLQAHIVGPPLADSLLARVARMVAQLEQEDLC